MGESFCGGQSGLPAAFVAGIRCQLEAPKGPSSKGKRPQRRPVTNAHAARSMRELMSMEKRSLEVDSVNKPSRFTAWLDGWVCDTHNAGPLRRNAPLFKRRWSGWLSNPSTR
mmetsp:Transcript_11425/g.34939  ORF Transcript_11425/g.34939 Transcript_11425/m.34939 type:complete len:112 (+) Transcript_11425:155-490(+)